MDATLAALIATVKDDPAADTNRLVLADWLAENGRDDAERARGELIHVQCRLAQLAPGDPVADELRARQLRLFGQFAAVWQDGLPPRPADERTAHQGYPVVWGFLRPCFGRGEPWLDLVPPDHPVWAWVDGLALVDPAVEEVARLAASPVLDQLNSLSLGPAGWSGWTGDRAIGPEGAAALAGSPHARRLVHLDLSDCVILAAGAVALAASPYLRRLTTLNLGGWDCTPANMIGDDGVRALAGSPHLASLTTLNLMENSLTAEAARAIAESPHLGGLTDLCLTNNEIGPEGARSLAASPYLMRLTRLELEMVAGGPFTRIRREVEEAEEAEYRDARELLRRRFGPAWHDPTPDWAR